MASWFSSIRSRPRVTSASCSWAPAGSRSRRHPWTLRGTSAESRADLRLPGVAPRAGRLRVRRAWRVVVSLLVETAIPGWLLSGPIAMLRCCQFIDRKRTGPVKYGNSFIAFYHLTKDDFGVIQWMTHPEREHHDDAGAPRLLGSARRPLPSPGEAGKAAGAAVRVHLPHGAQDPSGQGRGRRGQRGQRQEEGWPMARRRTSTASALRARRQCARGRPRRTAALSPARSCWSTSQDMTSATQGS